ncbi:MAG: hypothetical protein CVU05_07150, partial [Bacteroidetes bacterium HGW-Bacteroidetes-21]
FFTKGSLTGIEENINNAVSVNCFPNPAQTNVNFNITLTSSEDVAINIHDISGKLVFSQNFENMTVGENNLAIDTRNLENGMYLYTVSSAKGTTTGKLNIIK